MYSFKCDYAEGACDEIMNAMLESNRNQSDGYGMDPICEEARIRIKKCIEKESADVHFLVGGTQANLTVIASALRPYEGCIAVDSGHINVHETGAIEATGHKVLTVKGKDGKITPKEIEEVVKLHIDEHMVKPKLVYLSNATEIGTIYYEKELEAISKVCKKQGLYLFMDGARMGSALAAKDNDLSLKRISELVDVFYIGGTKNGALFGEAVVIINEDLKKDFRFMIKQRGGMLAKGRLLGIQFNELMKDNLLIKYASHANEMAQKIQMELEKAGYEYFVKTTTNQIFPIIPNEILKKMEAKYSYTFWEKIDDTHTAIRIVTSWATPLAVVNEFIKDMISCKESVFE